MPINDITVTPPIQNLDRADQYDLREMQLILSGESQAIDIRNFMSEFNIYEDMLGVVVSGNITISDSANMLSRIAFSGNERIRIVVHTATLSNPLAMEFIVYGISPVFTNPDQNSKRTMSYVMNFASAEKLKDMQIVVSKSYKAMSISSIVQDIVGPTYLNTQKQVFIEETAGLQDLIIPSFNPLKAIDWLSTRAISGTNNPDYVFFENHNGYYFISLETLFTTVPNSMNKYIVDPNGYNDPKTGMPDIARRMRVIKDFSIVSSPDVLQQTAEGVYASSLSTYDPVRMKFNTVNYSIIDGFSKMKGPGGFGTPPYLPNYDGANQPNSSRFFYPTNYNRAQTEYGKNDPSNNDTLVEQFMGRRQSLLAGMQTYKVRFMINGNLGLTVGTVCDLAIPDFDRKTVSDTGSLSSIYSGKYLATAIRHQFTQISHNTFVEAIKGSPNKGLGVI